MRVRAGAGRGTYPVDGADGVVDAGELVAGSELLALGGDTLEVVGVGLVAALGLVLVGEASVKGRGLEDELLGLFVRHGGMHGPGEWWDGRTRPGVFSCRNSPLEQPEPPPAARPPPSHCPPAHAALTNHASAARQCVPARCNRRPHQPRSRRSSVFQFHPSRPDPGRIT